MMEAFYEAMVSGGWDNMTNPAKFMQSYWNQMIIPMNANFEKK